MLRGSLKTLSGNSEAVLAAAGLAGTERAEELDLAKFCALARAYRELRGRSQDS